MVFTDPGGTAGRAAAPHAAASASGGSQDSMWQSADGPPPQPSVSLPKGGGAIRDLREKFSVNVATGAAGLAIPVANSPWRVGFGPSLSLSCDVGTGNGPFGFGWEISLSPIHFDLLTGGNHATAGGR
jgi:Salmonella virulence plasmid 65kDa B protein